MIANGQVRAERTGEASNALVIYHWAGEPEPRATTRAKLRRELETQLPAFQAQLEALAQTAAQLRQCLDRDKTDSAKP
jgi:hypothetical protein